MPPTLLQLALKVVGQLLMDGSLGDEARHFHSYVRDEVRGQRPDISRWFVRYPQLRMEMELYYNAILTGKNNPSGRVLLDRALQLESPYVMYRHDMLWRTVKPTGLVLVLPVNDSFKLLHELYWVLAGDLETGIVLNWRLEVAGDGTIVVNPDWLGWREFEMLLFDDEVDKAFSKATCHIVYCRWCDPDTNTTYAPTFDVWGASCHYVISYLPLKDIPSLM